MLRRGFAALALSAAATAQTTWYVDDDASGFGTGTFFDPYSSIQYAIERSTTLPGDQIVVFPGTYAENLDLVGKELHVLGLSGPAQTIVDGGGLASVLYVANGEGPGTLVEGLTLQNGFGASLPGGGAGGGAVYAEGVDLVLRNCVVRDSVGPDYGGGLFLLDSTVELDGCVVLDNEEGGGLHAEGCDLVVDQCRFEHNKRLTFVGPAEAGSGLHLLDCTTSLSQCELVANGNDPGDFDFGGGLFARGGTLHVVSTLFEGNRNEVRGGAIALHQVVATVIGGTFLANESVDDFWGGAIYVAADPGPSDLTLLGCTFEANMAGDGGALYFGAGQAHVDGCTFLQNSVWAFYQERGEGGAVYAAAGTFVTLARCVFVGNLAEGNHHPVTGNPGRGGAVYASAGTTLDRCTLVGNQVTAATGTPQGGGAYGGTHQSGIVWANVPEGLSGSAVATYSCIQGGWIGQGNTHQNPDLWSLPDVDLHLLPESPCIDTGDPSAPLDADGTRADMGAVPYDRDHCGPGCTGAIGQSFCAAEPNSTGNPAVLRGLGSDAVSDDRVLLFVDDLPALAPAVLLVSDVAFPRPFHLVGKSRVCLGIPKVLRNAQSDAAGHLDVDAAFATWPAGIAVLAGDTWSFQVLFHDVDPTPLRNTSSALRITFQ